MRSFLEKKRDMKEEAPLRNQLKGDFDVQMKKVLVSEKYFYTKQKGGRSLRAAEKKAMKITKKNLVEADKWHKTLKKAQPPQPGFAFGLESAAGFGLKESTGAVNHAMIREDGLADGLFEYGSEAGSGARNTFLEIEKKKKKGKGSGSGSGSGSKKKIKI